MSNSEKTERVDQSLLVTGSDAIAVSLRLDVLIIIFKFIFADWRDPTRPLQRRGGTSNLGMSDLFISSL